MEKPIFPVPKLSEGFFDDVIERIGGRRLNSEEIAQISENADYVIDEGVIELKIFEEEGIRKTGRQGKIHKLYKELGVESEIILINPRRIPSSIKRDFMKIVSGPIQTAVKKASRQIKETKKGLNRTTDLGILIAVNNGYKFLDFESFKEIVCKHVKNDTSHIDLIFCNSIEYHQGDYDSYVICESDYFSPLYDVTNDKLEDLCGKVLEKFMELMTEMMRSQTNPSIWKEPMPPLEDIIFEKDGVKFIRKYPKVPDSRFDKINI